MVHAVHAGITKLLMLATWLTRLNVVNTSRHKPAFSFLIVDYSTQHYNLGGITRHGGGNRYQSLLLIFDFGLTW